MDYYKLLDFYTEPFSNSPDPEFFFGSSSHIDCLQKLEISIRLRRGLCVVLGEVGAGKTTICRKLLFDLKDDTDIETFLILDPTFMGPLEMLGYLNKAIRKPGPDERPPSTESGYKELLKKHLFKKTVKENKNLVLIVDEAQKISSACLEVLRELLNYETNDHKLLQIVIFGQNEFTDTLKKHPNFTDRISLFSRVKPLSVAETRDLVNFRIQKASDYKSRRRPGIKFTKRSVKTLHALTSGHPRKIINLCHRVLMLAIIRNRYRITASMVRKAEQGLPGFEKKIFIKAPPWPAVAIAAGIVFFLAGFVFAPQVKNFIPFNLMTYDHSEDFEPAYSVRMRLDPVTEVEAGSLLLTDETEDNADSPEAEYEPETQDNEPVPDNNPDLTAAEENIDGHNSEFKMPDELGSIKVSRNENLWNIIERVYGIADIALMESVASANPHIKNIHRLYEGQRVFMPVQGHREPDSDEKWWVKLGTFSDLEQAYSFLLETDNRRLSILTLLKDETRPEYNVVWRRSFATKDKVRQEVQNIPSQMRASADIVHLGEKDQIIY